MRPDEHKRKKNAEYKKKHGISGKKEGKKEEIKKGQTEKPQESREKEETTSLGTEKKSFSRRKVTNNWNRYEEFEGETDDTHQGKGRRGEDFASLLERIGDSHSQFRFQAEKEWEEDLVGSEETQDVLKINFEDLSQSFSSLPLYKKLDHDEKEIYTEQEYNHDQRASIKQMLKCIDIYDELETLDVNQKRSSNLSLNQQPESQMNYNFFPTGADDSPETQENKKGTSNLRQSIKDLSETSQELNTSAVTGTLYSMGVIKKTDQLDDEELDFLLSLETGQHKRNSFPSPVNDKVATSAPQLTHSEEPDTKTTTVNASKVLLPQDEHTKSQADSSPDTKSETAASEAPQPKEDLEDWLDSVLG